MRRFGTQMNCPSTSGLAQLRILSSYWKERYPPMAILSREYQISWTPAPPPELLDRTQEKSIV